MKKFIIYSFIILGLLLGVMWIKDNIKREIKVDYLVCKKIDWVSTYC